MRETKLRFLIFRVALVICFSALGVRLWQLQVVSRQEYRVSADQNRYRLVEVDAPRGIMYDREGRLLVRNVPSFVLSIVPGNLPEDAVERERVLSRVGELLNMPVSDSEVAGATEEVETIEGILRERTIGQYQPVRIATGVDRQAAFVIEEEHLDLLGVQVEAEPVRQYLQGPLLAHIVGHMGSIAEADADWYDEQGYAPDDRVGRMGLELTQEEVLRGVKGEKHIEVDAYGQEMAVIAMEPSEPGHNVYLTIDVALQEAVEEALRRGMREAGSEIGVAIAMDPRSGEILAMSSLPSFDNNLFSSAISQEDWARLNNDPLKPLNNYAVVGRYPPGSTFKIVPATGALQEGVVDRYQTFTCQGMLFLPSELYPNDPGKAQPFYCWKETGHGALDIVQAIEQSCDIYFYKVTGGYQGFEGLGIEGLVSYARLFGFGEPTGVELPGEESGLLPSDRYKRQQYGETWYTGDTYNAAIGQGFILATPLQLLNATAVVANGGTLYRPTLVHHVEDTDGRVVQAFSPETVRELPVDDENLALVRQGMRNVVTQGTAWLLDIPEVPAAGKTGTAEFGEADEEGERPTHAWFTSFAPYQDPEIVLVIFLEGGGEGSQTAVPVAREILRCYFGLEDYD